MKRFGRATVVAFLAWCGALPACTSDLDLGIDRSESGSCSDCPQGCPAAAVDACGGGPLNADCTCAAGAEDAGGVVSDSGTDAADDAADADMVDEVDDPTESEDPEDLPEDAGAG